MAALHPTLKWAQRKDKVFLQVPLRDIEGEKVQLTENSIKFSCTAQTKLYQFNTEGSKWSKTGFHLNVVLIKKDNSQPYWPKLTKDKSPQFIQCDWDKWIDEEEEQEEGLKGLNDFNPDTMNRFDSDDEDQTPLDKNLDDLEGEEGIPTESTSAPQSAPNVKPMTQ